MRQPSDGGCVCCENESSAFVSVRPATAKPVDCKKSRRFTNYPQEVWRLVQDAAQRGHSARMMPQVLERIHQKTATTLSTVRTAHNQFAKGIVPVQRPSSMRSESGYYRVPVLSRSPRAVSEAPPARNHESRWSVWALSIQRLEGSCWLWDLIGAGLR